MRVAALLLFAAAAAGCGTTDDRPATFPYIATAILRPSCGTAVCHSTLNHRTQGSRSLILDNVDDAYAGLKLKVIAGDAAESPLLTDTLLTTDLIYRMPYDAPLPDADIDLISAWINAGAVGP